MNVTLEKEISHDFVILIINEAGIPILEYPTQFSNLKKILNVDNVLLSGLLNAISSFGKDVIGDEIRQINFGSLYLSFSRDSWKNLYVLIFRNIPQETNLLQRLHIETMALFNNSIKPILATGIDNGLLNSQAKKINLFSSIIDPFYKLWKKRLWKDS